MDKSLYEMIFKRKSFHLFRDIGNKKITKEELNDIENYFKKIKPLEDIKIKIKIVKDSTTCKRGQEYCILFYSEKKDNYLANVGYIGEQLDLYLVSKNIGALWFGIGKVKEKELDGLTFVIMIAIAKVDSIDKFRKDMYKSKRKEIKEMWKGEDYLDVANIVRFSPSACNTQPWFVEEKKDELKVYRSSNKRGIMPKNMIRYYNQIDIGIFLCFLELCLEHYKIKYQKEIYIDNKDKDECLIGTYKIIKE